MKGLKKINIKDNNRKKQRITIASIKDLKNALKIEGYEVDKISQQQIKEIINKNFEISKIKLEDLFLYIDEKVRYKVDNVSDFIDYIEKIHVFKNLNKKLYEKIYNIKTLKIERVEYERQPSIQDDISNIIYHIEKTASNVASVMENEKDKIKLKEIENQLSEKYLYAKDIELLKNILINSSTCVNKVYDSVKKIKTITIEIPKSINYEFIKSKKGSVEYHEYLTNNIPRFERLINNIDIYMTADKEGFKINQSEALQDSINIAFATYNKKEFKAISGSDEAYNCCRALPVEDTEFKSYKVNKLGKLGVGYNRINDSEKKIFEEINKQIKEKKLRDNGTLKLYSKWEPCPSCYYVISQFCKKYPEINVQVAYIKKYGE